MKKLLGAVILSGVFGAVAATAASAATVTYENADVTPKLQLIVDDVVSPGKIRFSLSTTVGTADYLGLGFNFAETGLDPSIMQSEITLISATKADGTAMPDGMPELQLFGNNTASQTDCGTGCNFGGAGSAEEFDYIIRIGESGGGGPGGVNYVKSVVFDIAIADGRELADGIFAQFAARAQSTTNPGGSIKADLVEVDDEPPAVPLPAGLPLLGSGLLALGIIRRRRRAK